MLSRFTAVSRLLAGLHEAQLAVLLTQAAPRRLTDRTVADSAQLCRVLRADLTRRPVPGRRGAEPTCLLGGRGRHRRTALLTATLSVGWPSGNMTQTDAVERFVPVLQKAAAEVSRFLTMGSHTVPGS